MSDIFGLFNKWGVILLYLLKYCFPGDFSWNLSYSRSCIAISIISLSRQHKCTLYLFLLPGCISFDLEIYRYLLSRSDLHRYRYMMLFHLCLIVKCQVRWSRNLSFDICNWYTHSVVIYICIYYTIPSTVKLWMSVILTCVLSCSCRWMPGPLIWVFILGLMKDWCTVNWTGLSYHWITW